MPDWTMSLMYLFIYHLHVSSFLFIHSFIYLFIYLFIFLFIYSFIYSFIHLFIYLFIYLSIYLSIFYLFIYMMCATIPPIYRVFHANTPITKQSASQLLVMIIVFWKKIWIAHELRFYVLALTMVNCRDVHLSETSTKNSISGFPLQKKKISVLKMKHQLWRCAASYSIEPWTTNWSHFKGFS